ncbi:hypothetical protein ACTWPB_07515 [Nocardia sp. IBHARD005]|uniref:hypothetical protein n=1 Tax=Nocardia sp. IBHARD005 TaxID=3457765 RepID=UPI0040580ED6
MPDRHDGMRERITGTSWLDDLARASVDALATRRSRRTSTEDMPMTAPCSCSPGACHGGHTIDVGPVTTTPPTVANAQLCPVCECGVVDDLVHIEHVHLGEVAAHNECLPIDVMLDAILSARKTAADARARITELEAAGREHLQVVEYLHYAHGIEIDRDDDDFVEWKESFGG